MTTGRISLVVKGPVAAAINAATLRGIAAEIQPVYVDGCIILEASEADWLRVVCWFMEDVDHRAPYAEGALLHYCYIGVSSSGRW